MVRNGKAYERFLKKQKGLPFLPLLLIYLLKEDRYLFLSLTGWLINWLTDWFVGRLIYFCCQILSKIHFLFFFFKSRFLIFRFLNIFQGFPFRDGRDLDRNRGSNNMGGVVNRRRSDGYNHDRGSRRTIFILVLFVESLCWFLIGYTLFIPCYSYHHLSFVLFFHTSLPCLTPCILSSSAVLSNIKWYLQEATEGISCIETEIEMTETRTEEIVVGVD